jgi:hypothetical protein
MLLQNLYPKGQNSVIPRPLAAGIGILKVLPVYFSKKVSDPRKESEMKLKKRIKRIRAAKHA